MPEDHVLALGDLRLELGGTLAGASLAYRTHGTLSEGRDNAVLFPHMYSGTQASLDPWIGPGRALDSHRWFVVCPGQLGNGSSTSPSTTHNPFPDLTIGDDVAAQHRLVTEELGIETVALALGFSMGAQQAYEWAVRFPRMVERLAVFAGLARTTSGNGLLVIASEDALRTGGTGQHARFWAATGLSAELYRREAWRDAGYDSVDDMVRRLFEDDYASRDPADLLCQLGKWRRADVSRQTGAGLPEALGRITARTVVAPFSHDAWFPVADCEAEQRLIGGSRLQVVESVWGHYGWGIGPSETAQIERVVADLLAT
ncbi:MAG TPA: alpha/beta fold hydrolase [Gaiellaceae bacterium]|nr:alpha/beta fold hydrolase [Gaiellaceae bacterium]